MRREQALPGGGLWIDISGPSPDDLKKMGAEFRLPPHTVADCLDPKHLPKIEISGDTTFLIFRAYEERNSRRATTMARMSCKLAIFARENLLLTVHRVNLPFLNEVFERCAAGQTPQRYPVFLLCLDLCKRAALTFEPILEAAEIHLERLEHAHRLTELNDLRGRLSTMKRLFWHTITVIQRYQVPVDRELAAVAQDLKETLESLMFFSDELLDDATSHVQLAISVASQRTNEVIRVLTIFSVFFMPLTFIVGIYGMNFRAMPEIEWAWGYPFTWGVMVAVTLAIALWFRRRGWLSRRRGKDRRNRQATAARLDR